MLALQIDLPSTASALSWWEWFLFATVLGILALLTYSTLGGGKRALGGIIAVIIFLASIACVVLGIVRLIRSVAS